MLPLTANGRVASPESVISGAAIPPSAALLGREIGELDVEDAMAIVEFAKGFESTIGEATGMIGVAVAEGGSMKTVLVTTAHWLAAGCVAMASAPPKVGAAAEACTVLVRVTSEMTLPVTDAAGGTVTVAVT